MEIKWRIQFKNERNVGCLINIWDDQDTGYSPDHSKTGADVPFAVEEGVTALTPSGLPFFFEEQNTNDLTSLIRYRTGYIKVVENVYGEVQEVWPTYETQRFVTVYFGSMLVFTGYIKCDNYSDKWDNYKKEVAFPVQSPLALLSHTFSQVDNVSKINVATALKEIIDNINPETDEDYPTSYQTVNYPNDIYDANARPNATNFSPFDGILHGSFLIPFTEKDLAIDYAPTERYSPITFREFLKSFCVNYGYMLHDTPQGLVFSPLRPAYLNKLTQPRYINVNSLDGVLTGGPVPVSSINTDFLSYFNIVGVNLKVDTIQPNESYTINCDDVGYEDLTEIPKNISEETQTGAFTAILMNHDPRISGTGFINNPTIGTEPGSILEDGGLYLTAYRSTLNDSVVKKYLYKKGGGNFSRTYFNIPSTPLMPEFPESHVYPYIRATKGNSPDELGRSDWGNDVVFLLDIKINDGQTTQYNIYMDADGNPYYKNAAQNIPLENMALDVKPWDKVVLTLWVNIGIPNGLYVCIEGFGLSSTDAGSEYFQFTYYGLKKSYTTRGNSNNGTNKSLSTSFIPFQNSYVCKKLMTYATPLSDVGTNWYNYLLDRSPSYPHLLQPYTVWSVKLRASNSASAYFSFIQAYFRLFRFDDYFPSAYRWKVLSIGFDAITGYFNVKFVRSVTFNLSY